MEIRRRRREACACTVSGRIDSAYPTGRAAPLLFADALYLAAVYVFFLAIPPLGRDYVALAHPDTIPFFRGMVWLFGGHGWLYLTTNLVLLYGCMAAILLLTGRITCGPWWLGSVAAVLFMANPVKTEAVLHVSAVHMLLPGLLTLCTLYVYVACRSAAHPVIRCVPLVVYVIVTLATPASPALFALIILLEYSVFKRRSYCWVPIAAVGMVAVVMTGHGFTTEAIHPARMIGPLFFVVYPIGLLPDTAAFFQAFPWVGHAIGIVLVIGALWFVWKLKEPAVTFGFLGAIVSRMGQGGDVVDPVTLAGGGSLLVPTAMLSIAVAGVFHAIMRNATWRRSVVRITTLLCVLAMCTQLWVNLHWCDAGRMVREFQITAVETAAAYPGEPLAVAPDIQYYRTAPVMLSESVRWDTPFSVSQPVVSLASVDVIPPVSVNVTRYSAESIEMTVQGLAVPAEQTPPFLSRCWWRSRYQPPLPVTLCFDAKATPFPAKRIPMDTVIPCCLPAHPPEW